MVKHQHPQRGFSLVEILITLALVTILSVVALNALTPWLTFKQALDTDRKLQDLRQGLQSAYEANAMTVESQASKTFMGLTNDAAVAGGQCTDQSAAFSGTSLATYMTESGQGAARDGFQNPVCIFITPTLTKDVEGVRIYYRMLAVVSTGQSGLLDAGTAFDPTTGQLTLGGDDRGVVVNGYGVQYAKYRDTLDRMNRLATLYESYFTTRFLNTADRDVSRDYFYSTPGTGGDPNGTIAPTVGWTNSLLAFGSALGVSSVDTTTPYETISASPDLNTIQVANYNESVTVRGATTTVRSPVTIGTGATPPYTALLRARLPGAADNYIVRAVVGNY